MKRLLAAMVCLVLLLSCLPVFSVAEPSLVAGDVNADGAVTMGDVLSLRRFLAGMISALSGDGDVNLDGAVNMKDVLLLRRFMAGLEQTLPTKAGQSSAATTAKTTHTTKGKTTWATKYPIDHDAPRINFIDNSAATLGVWWWNVSDAFNDTICAQYLTFLEENQVTEIYFYCAYMMTTAGNRAKVHAFVTDVMKRGMRVAVLFDNQNVVCEGDTSFANAVNCYLEYKTEYPGDDVYGLHCDIEPQAKDRQAENGVDAWTQGYVSNFIPQIAAARQKGVTVELDIGCGWWVSGAKRAYTGTVMHDYSGTTMDFFDILANNVDTMCMMSYRDTAKAILDMGAGGRAAADKAGCKIVYGVETGNDGEGDHVDFYAESKEIMYTELSRLNTKLESKTPTGGYGFAIHYMRAWDALRDTLDETSAT